MNHILAFLINYCGVRVDIQFRVSKNLELVPGKEYKFCLSKGETRIYIL